MNIVIDKHIPFIKGVFEPYFNVIYLEGNEITNSTLQNTDALIIRTRTKCNSKLLNSTKVKIIATATIGVDHIDLDYCNNAGIKVVNALGCNSGGVLQYVFTALYTLANKNNIKLPSPYNSLPDKNKLGVIGVGNVGSKVANFAEKLGFEVYRYDPWKEREQTISFNSGNISVSNFKDFYSLDYLLENSDIITVHIDLREGNYGFIDEIFFKKIKKCAFFINTSRGEVVDENALVNNIDKLSGIILDVWNNEPNINVKLLNMVDIATPHIAGYSMEGKVNGTTMVVKEIASHFGIEELKDFSIKMDIIDNNLNTNGLSQEQLLKFFTKLYPILNDDNNLRKSPEKFEQLRSGYNYRREFYVIG